MENSVYRILDANINRCREGLRVVEEYLRFVREDGGGSWQLKRWRHSLGEICDKVGQEKLLSARAASTDVGKDLVSPSPKDTIAAITTASFKRVQESLRVIEEYSAAVDRQVSLIAASMRFEVYEFEKELFVGSRRKRFGSVRLYLLIGSDCCPVENIVRVSEELLEAGVDCLQLREKRLSDKEIYLLAGKLAEVCRRKEKIFIVNDRVDIARAVGADGVHIGQGDLPVGAVRQMLGPGGIVGVSTHNLRQVGEAIELGPTYVATGPAFLTATKPHEVVAGMEFIRAASQELKEAGLPQVVIGGITPDRMPEIISAGVNCVAVCSGILGAGDPAAEVREFTRFLTGPEGMHEHAVR